ncbi:MAG TPA: cupin domain-containing protein [Afifellaceae bacterium]|nr:cupin domain-containing protein [Afifellaceae bacterium]
MKSSFAVRLPVLGLALCLGGALVPLTGDAAFTQDRGFTTEMLQQEDVGTLEGERSMRMVLLTMQPGAEIPEHQHAGPGLRYVLEGAIAIVWADGEERTFEAGSTYFEGPGANHPAGMISARNAADGETRVLIIEVLPKQ